MKGLSLKRGAEGAIVLSYAHGEEIDWEKVSSSHGRPRLELKAFFEKAKRFAPGIVAMISPSAASTDSPISLTPAMSGSVPPPNAGAASATPTSAADHEAEVA
jgi:hypothetical protein